LVKNQFSSKQFLYLLGICAGFGKFSAFWIMSKVKYHYDPESLSFKRVERQKGKTVGYGIMFVLAALLAGLFINFIAGKYVATPREKALSRELANMKLQFEIINKKMAQAEEVLSDIESRDNNLYRHYFETNPIPEEQRRAGFGGVNRYKDLEGYDNSELIIASQKRLDILQKQIVVQSKSLDEIVKLAEDQEKLLASIPAIQPVNNKDLSHMASGYGYRSDPYTKITKFHYGMDFTAPKNTPVYASGDGVVVRADSKSSGYGNHIRIDHGFGYVSLYAHLNKYNVQVNQRVKRGDLIGYVGSTGRSKAPHLHYEIFKDNERINPVNFYYGNLTPEEYNELLLNASIQNISLD
jgi:murein DD-endopeptidase MepM/ murein hydrolase activator NlpD